MIACRMEENETLLHHFPLEHMWRNCGLAIGRLMRRITLERMNEDWSLDTFFCDMRCQPAMGLNSDTLATILDDSSEAASGVVDQIRQNLRAGDSEEELIKFSRVCRLADASARRFAVPACSYLIFGLHIHNHELFGTEWPLALEENLKGDGLSLMS